MIRIRYRGAGASCYANDYPVESLITLRYLIKVNSDLIARPTFETLQRRWWDEPENCLSEPF